MNTTNPIFSLKNFRSFGSDGADFELAPITVLTGCNSAGKSSLVKALTLLSEKELDSFDKEILKISSKQLCLGGYNSVSYVDNKIIFSYRKWSASLHDNVTITKVFGPNRSDALDEGYLYTLSIEKSDGSLIYKASPELRDYKEDNIKQNLIELCDVGSYVNLMLKFIPIIKHKEKTTNSTNLEFGSEGLLQIAKEKLKNCGITEAEAASLWNNSYRDVYETLICATKPYREQLTISDCIKNYFENEREWGILTHKFIDLIVEESCSPDFIKGLVYINSASAQIARLYTIEDENKMCRALRNYNYRKRDRLDIDMHLSPKPLSYKPGSFLNKWIEKFEIGKSIEIKGTDEGLGLMIYLNTEKGKRLLADEGYGITQLVSLLLQIDNSIPLDAQHISIVTLEKDGLDCNLSYRYQPHTICVEEPEVHLHPKYQSLLAEMFVEACQKYNIHFIIETHSEYLIRKLQVMVADKENSLTSKDVSLNYVEKDEKGVSHNRQIKIQEDGRLDRAFGKGFYDEAGCLSRQLFLLNE